MRCSKDFAIDGADGYTAAEASLSTGETIERVFTYSAHYPFYSDALQCADRSGAADVGGRRYTYWLLLRTAKTPVSQATGSAAWSLP